TWAVKAHQRLQRELDLIQHFYEHTPDKQEKKQEEIAAQKRFTPKITHEIISGGLFYLDTRFPFQSKNLYQICRGFFILFTKSGNHYEFCIPGESNHKYSQIPSKHIHIHSF